MIAVRGDGELHNVNPNYLERPLNGYGWSGGLLLRPTPVTFAHSPQLRLKSRASLYIVRHHHLRHSAA